METPGGNPILWQAGSIALACTLINGLFLYTVVRLLKFGRASLARSLLASVACSTLILLGFLLPALVALQSCGFLGSVFSVVGAGMGIVLTFPLQQLVFGFSTQAGLVVWAAYAVFTPLVVAWTVLLAAWADIF